MSIKFSRGTLTYLREFEIECLIYWPLGMINVFFFFCYKSLHTVVASWCNHSSSGCDHFGLMGVSSLKYKKTTTINTKLNIKRCCFRLQLSPGVLLALRRPTNWQPFNSSCVFFFFHHRKNNLARQGRLFLYYFTVIIVVFCIPDFGSYVVSEPQSIRSVQYRTISQVFIVLIVVVVLVYIYPNYMSF